MTTTSDDGERTCPLCAEEMDLTDQQLKPCKCGYELCVWCWHHIIEMAEKEGLDGRCPACRTSYDKERIVGMASNERVVEINGDRKQKPQKSKPKASAEARKHLGSVRVIQRNLVYIIGLPSGLADESLLEHKEYFGQYGKVLKVSISRPTNGTQQASSSNTFGVYITYAKEEEAVRCIQAVHNFVLEGKPLRACFGTTKYCHAWLRNMPCSNPDCFYLHDIGSQEDSFSKDEIISAYTRSRVPQITSNNLQRRSGNTLPQPVDDFCNSGLTSAKITVKNTTNSSTLQAKTSSNGLPTRSTVLPAAASWGSRASNPTAASSSCLQVPPKQFQIGSHRSCSSSSVVCNANQSSAWHDDVAKQDPVSGNRVGLADVRSKSSEHLRACTDRLSQTAITHPPSEHVLTGETSAWNDDLATGSNFPEHNHSSNDRFRLLDSSKSHVFGDSQSKTLSSSADTSNVDQATSAWDDDDDVATVPSLSKENGEASHGRIYGHGDSSNSGFNKCAGTTSPSVPENILSDGKAKAPEDATGISHKQSTTRNSSSPAILQNGDIIQEDILSTSDVLFSKEVDRLANSITGLVQSNTDLDVKPDRFSEGISSVNVDPSPPVLLCLGTYAAQNAQPRNSAEFCDMRELQPECYLGHTASLPVKSSHNIHTSAHIQRESPDWSSDLWRSPSNSNERLGTIQASGGQKFNNSFDIGHASYLTHDAQSSSQNHSSCTWNNNYASTTTSHVRPLDISNGTSHPSLDGLRFGDNYHEGKFGKLFNLETASEFQNSSSSDEVQDFGSLADLCNVKVSADSKEDNIIAGILSMDTSDGGYVDLFNGNGVQNNSVKIASSWKGQSSNQSRFSFARQEDEPTIERYPSASNGFEVNDASRNLVNGLYSGHILQSVGTDDPFGYSLPVTSSDKISAVSRAKVSAPPGFSAPNRAPPPGFPSQDRLHLGYDTMPSGFSLAQNQYQMSLAENSGDVELIDPAILAVHKGHSPYGLNSGLRGFPLDINASETDLRFQHPLQSPISTHQAQMLPGQNGDGFLSTRDAFYHKQLLMQNQNSLSHLNQMPVQATRNSFISTNQWNGWNDMQNAMGLDLSELARAERQGFNHFLPANEELRFHRPSTAHLYNRSYGI